MREEEHTGATEREGDKQREAVSSRKRRREAERSKEKHSAAERNKG